MRFCRSRERRRAAAVVTAALVLCTAAPASAGTDGRSAAVVIETGAADADGAELLPGRFEDTLALHQFEEAEVLAKRSLEELLRSAHPDRVSRASALQNLALVQRHLQQFDASLKNYDAAIAIIEEDGDRLSPRLVEPLRGLARTQAASGDPERALLTAQRALHIRRVNEGPHTLRQVEILTDMIDAKLLAHDLRGALGLLDRVDVLYERTYSPDSPELLPALRRRAGLLKRLGDYDAERQVYRRIVGITANDKGALDPALIEPYLQLAGTYISQADKVVFRSGPTTQTGETYLEKALDIAERNPETGWQTLERCLLALGDYYMVLGVHDKARLSYRRAWDLTSSGADHLEHRRQHLERPVVLRPIPLGRYADFAYGQNLAELDEDELAAGFMTVTFTVNARGEAHDIEVVDADPAPFERMETRIRLRLKDFVFRPRYADGEPAPTAAESLRHEFLYLPSTLAGS